MMHTPTFPLPTFDVREIPFSVRGSWLNLSPVVALQTNTDAIHVVSHRNGMHAVLRCEPVTSAPVQWSADAATLTWQAGGASVRAVFEGLRTVRLRGEGMALKLVDSAGGLTPFTGTYLFTDPIDGSAVFTSYETGRRYRVTSLVGGLEVFGQEALGIAQRAVVLGSADRE